MKTIKGKILLSMILTVVISLFLVGSISIYLNYSSTNETLEQTMVQTAKVAADRVSQELQAYMNVAMDAGTIARLADPAKSAADKQEIINQRVSSHGFIRGNILDKDGSSIFDGKNYADRWYFQEAMTGKACVSDPIISKITNELTIIVAAPLWKDGIPNTQIAGVIYFVPPETFLNDIVGTIKVSSNGSAYMLSKEGYTIAHQNMDNVKNMENTIEDAKSDSSLAQLASIEGQMVSGSSGFGTYTYGGVTKFSAYAPVQNSNGWSLAINAPNNDFIGSTILGIILTFLLLIACSLAAAFIAFRLSHKIGSAIKACTNRLVMLAEGDLTSPVDAFDTKDETQTLSEATNKIVFTINGIFDDLGWGLEELSKGNFTADSKHKEYYVGDYAPIAKSVYSLIDHLSDALRTINISAQQVDSGAEQVSSGAQALSQGTTEQASAVEELAATIADISSQVNSNADNAQQASAMANTVGDQIQETNEQMSHMTQAINDIRSKSHEIGKIIKTIEDIAFQTNILALNAAVEAARAGAAGKGFAVVADEVRNLASKSAEASQNTAALIESSIQSVENGTQITIETARTLETVVVGAREIVTAIDKIADASKTQAESISQVTQGIDQISSVVQTNSATAEESAAASEELSGQARMLKTLISKFKLNEKGAIHGLDAPEDPLIDQPFTVIEQNDTKY